MNQQIKTWVGTVIIIIIAITVGVSMWLAQKNNPIETPTQNAKTTQPTPQTAATDETADWKKYTNGEYGYEMKYPAMFGELFSPMNSGNPIASAEISGLDFQIQFFLQAFGPINNLEDAFKISTRGNGFQERIKKDITFNGVPAIEYAGINNSRNVHVLVGVLNGKYFDLDVESKNSTEEADALFQKIFANFKVLK